MYRLQNVEHSYLNTKSNRILIDMNLFPHPSSLIPSPSHFPLFEQRTTEV
jgi:hypothetical protein